MARIRTYKPEFYSAEQPANCSIFARYTFLGLLPFCDDGGVHPASVARVKMQIFPNDTMAISEIQRWIGELIQAGLLEEFEAEGKRFWRVTGWHHQKIDKPTYIHPRAREYGEAAAKRRRALGDGSSNDRRGGGDSSPPESNGVESNGVERKGDEDSCPETGEPSSGPPQPDCSKSSDKVVLTFPVDGKQKSWNFTESNVVDLEDAFPALDIVAEARKALAWVKAAPKRRKTTSGMGKFLFNWMTTAQNGGGGQRLPGPQQTNRKKVDLPQMRRTET